MVTDKYAQFTGHILELILV